MDAIWHKIPKSADLYIMKLKISLPSQYLATQFFFSLVSEIFIKLSSRSLQMLDAVCDMLEVSRNNFT